MNKLESNLKSLENLKNLQKKNINKKRQNNSKRTINLETLKVIEKEEMKFRIETTKEKTITEIKGKGMTILYRLFETCINNKKIAKIMYEASTMAMHSHDKKSKKENLSIKS